MGKYKNLFLPVLIILSFFIAIFSYTLQFKINKFDKDIKNLNKEISDIDEEIKVLKTELSHLTSITRIKKISNRYLSDYKLITFDDFIKVMDIPINPKLE